MTDHGLVFRKAVVGDLVQLLALEERSFASDRLSRRSFKRWLASDHCFFWVAADLDQVVGYILVIYHRGTRLGRLYSVAVDDAWRGRGVARQLIERAEQDVIDTGRLFLRLEVSTVNPAAISLYEAMGYRQFGVYRDYYEDHQDALRMQKRVRRYHPDPQQAEMPWIRQTTEFTCGPAALMMAMASLDKTYQPGLHEELQIWREATTIFMTSGHGGCHPVGLALAARARGFQARVWLSVRETPFIDGVRDADKKRIIELVHQDFLLQAASAGIPLVYGEYSQQEMIDSFSAGAIPVILISTYRMDGKKSPHWVSMSGVDESCIYVHDPHPEEESQKPLDCQYLPVSRSSFDRMAYFGRQRLRTAVVISKS